MHASTTLQRLFGHKASADDELLAVMKHFEETHHEEDRDIALRILNHSYVVDRIFAANLQRTDHGYKATNTAQLPAPEDLSEAIRTSDQWYVDYVASLGPAGLTEAIDFTFTDGAPGRMTREEMLMHVALHSGYHRGQIGLIMLKHSISPPADLFTGYLHKTEATTRRRLC